MRAPPVWRLPDSNSPPAGLVPLKFRWAGPAGSGVEAAAHSTPPATAAARPGTAAPAR